MNRMREWGDFGKSKKRVSEENKGRESVMIE